MPNKDVQPVARGPHVAQGDYECGLKTFFFAHQFSLVFVYLMCGPRQLFFFQCGSEMPEGWTPLA